MTIFDLTWWSDVNLDTYEASKSLVDPADVDYFAHDMAVQDMNHQIAALYIRG